jgi:hypothetical protein
VHSLLSPENYFFPAQACFPSTELLQLSSAQEPGALSRCSATRRSVRATTGSARKALRRALETSVDSAPLRTSSRRCLAAGISQTSCGKRSGTTTAASAAASAVASLTCLEGWGAAQPARISSRRLRASALALRVVSVCRLRRRSATDRSVPPQRESMCIACLPSGPHRGVAQRVTRTMRRMADGRTETTERVETLGGAHAAPQLQSNFVHGGHPSSFWDFNEVGALPGVPREHLGVQAPSTAGVQVQDGSART